MDDLRAFGVGHATVDRSILALVVVAVVGVAVMLPPVSAVALLVIAGVVLAAALVLERLSVSFSDSRTLNEVVAVATLAIGLALFLTRSMDWVLNDGVAGNLVGSAGVVTVVIAGTMSVVRRGGSRWWFVIFLLAFFVVQVVVLDVSRAAYLDVPFVDVTYFHVEASRTLVSGANPYTIELIDRFSGVGGFDIYGPGVSIDGILQFGFPYPPLSLLVVTPFHVLFGDFRVAMATAWVAIAWMIAGVGPSGDARRVATVFLLLVPSTAVTVIGYTELVVAIFGIAVILAHNGRSRARPYLFGMFVAAKQYIVVASPAYLLLIPRPWTPRVVAREALRSLVALLVVTLPLALWDVEAFVRSVVLLQFRQRVRSDAMTVTAQVVERFDVVVPQGVLALVPLIAVVGAVIVVLRFGPMGSQGYALGTAFILLVFFLFAKQGFPNYYVLVMVFAAAAAAGRGRSKRPC